MSQDCNRLKKPGVSIKEFRQPAIGTVHELGYFFGDAERKVKEPEKSILVGETVCARLYLVLGNSIGCPENSKRTGVFAFQMSS